MKHIKEYNWSFHRRNSKNKVIFKHHTSETLDEVTDFLDKKKLEYDVMQGATMLWIYYKNKSYAYYYTTGRWAPFSKKSNYPKKHYHSKGIKDFYERFLTAKQETPVFKSSIETVEDITKVLNYAKIEYTIDGNVATLISKIIPRKDGKGNRKRYSYQYIIGEGKWRHKRSNGKWNEYYYQTKSIENFLTNVFIDEVELKYET